MDAEKIKDLISGHISDCVVEMTHAIKGNPEIENMSLQAAVESGVIDVGEMIVIFGDELKEYLQEEKNHLSYLRGE